MVDRARELRQNLAWIYHAHDAGVCKKPEFMDDCITTVAVVTKSVRARKP